MIWMVGSFIQWKGLKSISGYKDWYDRKSGRWGEKGGYGVMCGASKLALNFVVQ